MSEEFDEKVLAGLAGLEERMKALAAEVGIPVCQPDGLEKCAEELLLMPPTGWGKLSADDCGEAAAVLAQLSFYLQKKLNEENAKQIWADECVRRLIADTVGSKQGWTWEERKQLAVLENPRAMQVEKIRVEARLRCEQIAWLPARVEWLAKTLLSLQASKRVKKDGND